ncbi:MAG: FMN-binding protein [Chloroflexota bacterium]|nr:FMN-binding protein [Chloroflexota bacterium]
MKRALSALAATVAGVAFLAGYKATPANGVGQGGATPSPSAAAASADPAAGSAAAPTASAAPAATSLPAAAAGGPSRSVTGQVIDTQFGEVQVKVTLSGKRITDVQALQLPFDRARSAYISQVAGPMLRSEVLQAQSANIDIISGATYTSMAYGQSLQSALGTNN